MMATVQTQKRGRGRPRATESAQGPKRGRGKPPNKTKDTPAQSQDNDDASSASMQAPVFNLTRDSAQETVEVLMDTTSRNLARCILATKVGNEAGYIQTKIRQHKPARKIGGRRRGEHTEREARHGGDEAEQNYTAQASNDCLWK
ncbi:hypothetical protein CC86DRAFT_32314 [Ophiobolus disseminans]|uniref:Uncharacterized protein n=1 Tax=Ophiobolus disseminans TaxID=1469910 RepID=A0A6A6ZZY3_9PLEO|nr:hypothetical protein CC86DRAFT_32314 [Ophiobolus disseminans]